MFGSAMLLISAVFPLSLPPEYTPQLAAQFTSQPDWYFLWIYQILKISIFEGTGLPVALSLVTLIFVVLVVLPFVDRGQARQMRDRPMYVTLGLIFIAELIVLAYWGLESPGQIIGTEEAVLVLGGTAILVGALSWVAYRSLRGRGGVHAAPNASGTLRTAVGFVSLLAGGATGIGWSLNGLVRLVLVGPSFSNVFELILSCGLLTAVMPLTVLFLYGLESRNGSLKRRFRILEIGRGNK